MATPHLSQFNSDISGVKIPSKLNNPFSGNVPEIARIAAKEFQQSITAEIALWKHDFDIQKGKMFGILVIENEDQNLSYLRAISGKIPEEATKNKFTPSIFDDSTNSFYINKGMSELTELGNKIKYSTNQPEIKSLTKIRKQKSIDLQNWLFENYNFQNILGEKKNTIAVFKSTNHANPPSATGECAAPKLLQYAFKNKLKPIALAEFWWGKAPKNLERNHLSFYPACKNKCRPILEYMLNDFELFNNVNIKG